MFDSFIYLHCKLSVTTKELHSNSINSHVLSATFDTFSFVANPIHVQFAHLFKWNKQLSLKIVVNFDKTILKQNSFMQLCFVSDGMVDCRNLHDSSTVNLWTFISLKKASALSNFTTTAVVKEKAPPPLHYSGTWYHNYFLYNWTIIRARDKTTTTPLQRSVRSEVIHTRIVVTSFIDTNFCSIQPN